MVAGARFAMFEVGTVDPSRGALSTGNAWFWYVGPSYLPFTTVFLSLPSV